MPQQHAHFCASNLFALRESAGVSRTALAAVLGLTEQTVWSWEAGRSVPRLSRIGALANALGCHVDAFFAPFGADDPAGRTPGAPAGHLETGEITHVA